jgi:hypothetical protein
MFLHVTDIRYANGYRFEIVFSDGEVKEVDLEGELHGEVFEPLRNLHFFRQAFLNRETGTIEWPNGADFAPEYLHEIGKEVMRSS